MTLRQDVGPCCEQTHAAFEVGLSLGQGQGVYSGWSDVDGGSQLRLCHTCIIDVMLVYKSDAECRLLSLNGQMTLKVKVNYLDFQYHLKESQDAYLVQIWWF